MFCFFGPVHDRYWFGSSTRVWYQFVSCAASGTVSRPSSRPVTVRVQYGVWYSFFSCATSRPRFASDTSSGLVSRLVPTYFLCRIWYGFRGWFGTSWGSVSCLVPICFLCRVWYGFRGWFPSVTGVGPVPNLVPFFFFFLCRIWYRVRYCVWVWFVSGTGSSPVPRLVPILFLCRVWYPGIYLHP